MRLVISEMEKNIADGQTPPLCVHFIHCCKICRKFHYLHVYACGNVHPFSSELVVRKLFPV